MLETLSPGVAHASSAGVGIGGMKPMVGADPMGGMGPAPGGKPAEMSEDEKTCLEVILAALDSGEVDISKLAESAPEGLQTIADNMGVDLETVIEDMVFRIEENSDPREEQLPPPLQSDQQFNQQGLKAYAAQTGSMQAQNTMAGLPGAFLNG